MLDLFEILCDLKSIEKSEREILSDAGDHMRFEIIYLLHLDCNKFLIIDEDYEIIGDGKDMWFGRMFYYDQCKQFSFLEIESYQELLRQLHD